MIERKRDKMLDIVDKRGYCKNTANLQQRRHKHFSLYFSFYFRLSCTQSDNCKCALMHSKSKKIIWKLIHNSSVRFFFFFFLILRPVVFKIELTKKLLKNISEIENKNKKKISEIENCGRARDKIERFFVSLFLWRCRALWRHIS